MYVPKHVNINYHKMSIIYPHVKIHLKQIQEIHILMNAIYIHNHEGNYNL